ncbi:MAG: YggS family pyridoxal phosphate-dependent enzyme, partial [Microvirga sp.]|nr:YggS family pyridoxal phosphate-dependent enzyme [Microvirga sp.]
MTEHDPVAGLQEVEAGIARAATGYDRDPASITLVAVSKLFPAADIEAVLAVGHRVFGENYVKEAAEKWPALRQRYPDVELHLIGPLQSNK